MFDQVLIVYVNLSTCTPESSCLALPTMFNQHRGGKLKPIVTEVMTWLLSYYSTNLVVFLGFFLAIFAITVPLPWYCDLEERTLLQIMKILHNLHNFLKKYLRFLLLHHKFQLCCDIERRQLSSAKQHDEMLLSSPPTAHSPCSPSSKIAKPAVTLFSIMSEIHNVLLH